jgi:hypothetical protein
MKLIRTTHFERNYANAPQQVQRAFDKQSLQPASRDETFPSLPAFQRAEQPFSQSRVIQNSSSFQFQSLAGCIAFEPLPPPCYFQIG